MKKITLRLTVDVTINVDADDPEDGINEFIGAVDDRIQSDYGDDFEVDCVSSIDHEVLDSR